MVDAHLQRFYLWQSIGYPNIFRPATVIGSCGPPGQPVYDCATGTTANNVNGSTQWTWKCNGSNTSVSTDDVSCSEPKLAGPTLSFTQNCSVPNYTLTWSPANT